MRWKGWGDLFWGGDYWIPMDEGNTGWLGGWWRMFVLFLSGQAWRDVKGSVCIGFY